MTAPLKDAMLDRLAETGNVAQFVSFSPDLQLRFARLPDFGHRSGSLQEAIDLLFKNSPEKKINVRSFRPDHPRGNEFIYGLELPEIAISHVRRLSADGLYTIVNETVDIHDGGVSGVLWGDTIEFAPDSNPRCVEEPDVCVLPRALGLRLLSTVYSFEPELAFAPGQRVEFSVHPVPRGVRRSHTILWELESREPLQARPLPCWPNRFSRFLGDKLFGLLVADALDLPVPHTTAISRRVAPFRFGRHTRSLVVWLRTCPREQVPGLLTTTRGWQDPFALMALEDPSGQSVPSVIAQSEVTPVCSGSLITERDGALLIEGVTGRGDAFMRGDVAPCPLPAEVNQAVEELHRNAAKRLGGPVRFEWVFDGAKVWIVQFHSGRTETQGVVIFPGSAKRFHRFPVERRLADLYDLAKKIEGSGDGIVLVGSVGLTSHMSDILRKARIPAYLESA
jgi:hypothetical protein